jgi:hypothetical protein
MKGKESLRIARNLLLKLHKLLIERERAAYEDTNGPVGSAEFVNLLIGDPRFAWLRRFSTLIVEVDEMFDQKDGIESTRVDELLEKVRKLIEMKDTDDDFRTKYQESLRTDINLAELQKEINDAITPA